MKRLLIKTGVLIAVFIAFVAVHFISIYDRETKPEEVMQEATLPIVNLIYKDYEINMLQGYTTYMDGRYMRESITPVTAERTLGIDVSTYGNVIASMSYEIRSLDTERLIDKQDIERFAKADNHVHASIDISSIIEADTEYLLIIHLVTERHADVYYYTRIKEQSDSAVAAHLDFVTKMSESSLDNEAAHDYLPYLEPSSSSDNTNLASVNIKSSFSNFTWGGLNVKRVTQPVVIIKELIDDIGCYELKYKVRAENEYGTTQYYNVTEYFRVREGVDVMYLYVYERNMEQIFDGTPQTVSNKRINLGLDSDLEVEYSFSNTGNYVTFVKERNLWMMDMKRNKIMHLFSFESGSDNDVRDIFSDNDIDIVSTSDKGEVLFMVYGYMNRGSHEGKVGTALFRYDRTEDKVEELVFVPTDKPYHVMRESMGKFAYIKDNSLLYVMLEDAIYTVTFDSNEYVQLVSGLKQGNYVISDDKKIIAWHENSSIYGAESIRVINVQTGDDYVIKAESDEYIKTVGFIEHDLIYGTAKKDAVYRDEMGDTVFPMFKLNVVLESKENIESYQKDGIYIVGVSIEGNMLKLDRISYDENNLPVAIDEDTFVNKNVASKPIVTQSVIATEFKKKELTINFAYNVTSENDLEKIYPEEIIFIQGNSFEAVKSETPDPNYYVYGEGRLLMVTEKEFDAINVAYDNYGVVVNGRGEKIYARSGKVNAVGIDMKYMVGQGYDSFEAAKSLWQGEVIDVSKAYYDTLFYYVTKRMPVAIMHPEYGLVCIDGYNGYSGLIHTVYMTDFDTGTEFDMTYRQLEELYNECGMRYMVMK